MAGIDKELSSHQKGGEQITEKESIFNERNGSKDILTGDPKIDIPKFEEIMTLLLKRHNLPEEVAISVAETIAKVSFLEKMKVNPEAKRIYTRNEVFRAADNYNV